MTGNNHQLITLTHLFNGDDRSPFGFDVDDPFAAPFLERIFCDVGSFTKTVIFYGKDCLYVVGLLVENFHADGFIRVARKAYASHAA